MSRPGFIEGAVVALGLAIVAAVGYSVLALVSLSADAPWLIAALLGLLYQLYLMTRGPRRSGRALALMAWGLATALTAWLPLMPFLLVQATCLWLSRCLFHQRGLPALAADLGLVLFGFAAMAVALTHTASIGLAVWCFFLIQALFGLIPGGTTDTKPVDQFDQAAQNAEAAMQRLSVL